MPRHAERRSSPYRADQLFALVERVEDYPKFLPWCVGARVKRLPAEGHVLTMEADLILGFKGLRESFRSRVVSDPDELTIDSRLLRGPFSHLENHWRFEPKDRGCIIDFQVEFSFSSKLLSTVVEPLFMTAQKRLVAAFEARAQALYGADQEGSARDGNDQAASPSLQASAR